MSLFYSSNEKKERRYVKENKIRELNDEAQQQIVDDEIDRELGLEKRASNISRLTKRITDKLVGVQPEIIKGNDILLNSINNSNLTELFNKIKTLPDSSLNKTQRLIRDDLKNGNSRGIINELIAEAVPNGVDAIKQTVLDALGGTDVVNNELVLDMIFKTNKINARDLTVKNINDKKEAKERTKKSKEDYDINSIEAEDLINRHIKKNQLSNLFKKIKETEQFDDKRNKLKSKLEDPRLIESLNNTLSEYIEKGDEEHLGSAILNKMNLNSREKALFKVMANEVMPLKGVFRDPGAPTKITKDTVEDINKQRQIQIEKLQKQLDMGAITKSKRADIKKQIKNKQNAIVNDSNRFSVLSSQFSS